MPNKGERAADGSQRQAGLAKRFYKQVTTESDGGEGAALCSTASRYGLPARRLCDCRRAALAEAIAEEWRAQGERIDPAHHAAHPDRQQRHRRRRRARAGGDRRHHGACRLRPRLLPGGGAGRPGQGATEALGSRAGLGQGPRWARRCCLPRASRMSRSREPRSTGSRAARSAAMPSASRRCM